jgi:hypothetical protein
VGKQNHVSSLTITSAGQYDHPAENRISILIRAQYPIPAYTNAAKPRRFCISVLMEISPIIPNTNVSELTTKMGGDKMEYIEYS